MSGESSLGAVENADVVGALLLGAWVPGVPIQFESRYGDAIGRCRIAGSPVRRSEGYQIFLQVLIDQRLGAGLTQAEVAEALGKPQSFVSKYERGERRLDFVEALQVSQALGLDPKRLLARLKEKEAEK